MKYLGINPTKGIQDLYRENNKIIESHYRLEWKDVPCLLIAIPNILKIYNLSNWPIDLKSQQDLSWNWQANPKICTE